MGRLFTRLLCGVVEEILLFDYFDDDNRTATVAKVLTELRSTVEKQAWSQTILQVIHLPPHNGWTVEPAAPGLIQRRAIIRLAPAAHPAGQDKDDGFPSWFPDLSSLLERYSTHHSTMIFAGLPEDADELLPRADVILLALSTPRHISLAEALQPYLSRFSPGSLVIDLGSTQHASLDLLARLVDRTVGLLGAHPLFGPAVSDLAGLIVAIIDAPDCRARSRWQDWFLDQLARLRLIVTPTTLGEHDDAMAFVQSLTHFALLSFAYTFVLLDRDPLDLLAFRTPVFEPLLYLAARVAYLARSSPDTYRSIQIHTTRPEVRAAFLEAAHRLLAAIEESAARSQAPAADPADDPLVRLFQEFGSPWSPDDRDRRERQKREHFLEMGARLVDDLNRLRQELVAAAGEVRAIEETRLGQPPRVLIGIVDLDLAAPDRQDIASRIRLRPINLLLGSTRGGEDGPDTEARDYVIPLARARILDDDELFDWLLDHGELVERRSCPLLIPEWFDCEILTSLLKGFVDAKGPGRSRVWRVDLDPIAIPGPPVPGCRAALVTLVIVLHPAEIVRMRQEMRQDGLERFTSELHALDVELERIRERLALAASGPERDDLRRQQDVVKHRRKALIDQRTATLDRQVRRATRARVHAIYQAAVEWLLNHGCTVLPPR